MNVKLSENIFQYRSARGWSQNDLADALDVSRQSVSKWENNLAVPDLDKLIRMTGLFEVSLDELVFGPKAEADKPKGEENVLIRIPSARIIAGLIMLIFGMIFFLLSVFWGDHILLGEAFGELCSSVIVLLSLSLIATDNFRVLSVCALIYFLYSIVCFGVMNVTSLTNYLFTFVAGCVILVWFIVCGLRATKGREQAEVPVQ
ncbi:MAG: helix-turn-helix transcriptional regulator [Clostridia bacterium]|nr:helix-turn-helix transcriptional regulator [Clostridia bacterium]